MTDTFLRLPRLLVLCLALAPAAIAEPISYAIDTANSRIGFEYQFGKDPVKGNFPDYSASLSLDFDAVKNSKIAVQLKTQTATAGFAFGTQAMRGAKVLDAKNHPEIRFQSTRVTGGGNTAEIFGDITVRGVTKPMKLTAQLFRPQGTAASQRDRLILRLNGTLDRNDFGAGGFPEYVGDDLKIEIDAEITRQ